MGRKRNKKQARKHSKWAKVPETHQAAESSTANDAPAPALVAEVHGFLIEASRKELHGLLTLLLKASSQQALEIVRSEAVQRGVYVPIKPSRFQQCSKEQLDSFFSFLEPADLRVADAVCRRWHCACTHENAGWLAALTRSPCAGSARWMREFSLRRMNAAKLHVRHLQLTASERSPDALAIVGRLPSLTSLSCSHKDGSRLHLLRNPRLRTLYLQDGDSGFEPLSAALDAIIAAPFARVLTNLDLACSLSDVHLLCRLPKLSQLKLWIRQADASEIAIGNFVAPSVNELTINRGASVAELLTKIRFPELRVLHVATAVPGPSSVDRAGFAAVSNLPRLRFLEIGSRHVVDAAAVVPLANCVSLVHLSIGCVRHSDAASALAAVSQLSQLESLHFAISPRSHHLPDQLAFDWTPVLLPLQALTHLREVQWKSYSTLNASFFQALPPTLNALCVNCSDSPLAMLDALSGCLPALHTLMMDVKSGPRFDEYKERVLQVRPKLDVKNGNADNRMHEILVAARAASD